MNNYLAPQASHWQGRYSPPEQGIQYWHQAILLADLSRPDWPRADIGLLGYASDEGVRRNQGRFGACQGPVAIREALGKLAFHLREKTVVDLGDLQGPEMERTQTDFAQAIEAILARGVFPIGLGGGHDLAYAHASGIFAHLERAAPGARLGIINLDAHFDLRPVVGKGNSGTPFAQILDQWGQRAGYLPIGIQHAANPPALFEMARHWQVDFIPVEACHWPLSEAVTQRLQTFIDNYDALYLSIDLDGFSVAYAPGVSAPSPLGFAPAFALAVITQVIASRKLISCDLAEFNPKYDRDGQTGKLAAHLINKIANSL